MLSQAGMACFSSWPPAAYRWWGRSTAGPLTEVGKVYLQATLSPMPGRSLDMPPAQTDRHSLTQLFDFAEQTIGRERCLEIVRDLLNPPLPVEPTLAHVAAVRRFPVILTTNYDCLFEQACQMLNISFVVRTPGRQANKPLGSLLTIFKIDGSIDRPESLVLTPAEATLAREDKNFWADIEEVLNTARPIVIGHSMRDATSLWLMSRRKKEIKGIYVAPVIDAIDRRLLLERLNLRGVESSASAYLWSERS